MLLPGHTLDRPFILVDRFHRYMLLLDLRTSSFPFPKLIFYVSLDFVRLMATSQPFNRSKSDEEVLFKDILTVQLLHNMH